MPAFGPVIVQALVAFRPINVLMAPPPASVAVITGAPEKSNVSLPAPPLMATVVPVIPAVVEKAPPTAWPKSMVVVVPALTAAPRVTFLPAVSCTKPVPPLIVPDALEVISPVRPLATSVTFVPETELAPRFNVVVVKVSEFVVTLIAPPRVRTPAVNSPIPLKAVGVRVSALAPLSTNTPPEALFRVSEGVLM